jgi:hypothetical protein
LNSNIGHNVSNQITIDSLFKSSFFLERFFWQFQIESLEKVCANDIFDKFDARKVRSNETHD